MEIKRDLYLNKLVNAIGNGSIKVITGVRRCGKSYILNTLFYNHLLKSGIDKSHIIKFAFDVDEDISLLDNEQTLAVVGSREYSEYGKFCTEKIISEIAKGRVIISGLAKGIDALAHESAIRNGGRTIAVLGSGIDNCYPTENKELYEEIKKNHLVISEYPGMSTPDKKHFPMRNRIVVGLSNGVYVPQINSYMSGTMISFGMAAEMNKDVFVAPDVLDSPTVNNRLIEEGASITINGETILTSLRWR